MKYDALDQNKHRGLQNDKDIHDQDVRLLQQADGMLFRNIKDSNKE